MRQSYPRICLMVLVVLVTLPFLLPTWQVLWWFLAPVAAVGIYDYGQRRHAIRRNFPIIGHFRYLFEAIRPEIQQYFVENDQNGVPFNREQRSLVYQRSKSSQDTMPFGTKLDVYATGYEWVEHSLHPLVVTPDQQHVMVGGPECQQPYRASLLNISAMSYGSLSSVAIQALNQGAKIGGFAHNTGEGGLSPHHRQGGDIIWQIGTGYFGCRSPDGQFDEQSFGEKAAYPEVKMIEIKLSQGAKPGHGGILPASKVTREIAQIRGVAAGVTVVSPPAHTAFSNPEEMMNFVAKVRVLAGGKPVGIKLCLGKKSEFVNLCQAMVKTGHAPDYIAIDGGEGGTGAAPLEFSNRIGCPLKEALLFVQNCLVGFNLRPKIRVIAGGKISNSYVMLSYLAMGADLCYAARPFMMALGCIQALRCHSNDCPTGVATQNASLSRGLVVPDKAPRVAQFHKSTIKELCEIIGAMGYDSHTQLRPHHIIRRLDSLRMARYSDIYQFIEPGSLLTEPYPDQDWYQLMANSSTTQFRDRNGA